MKRKSNLFWSTESESVTEKRARKIFPFIFSDRVLIGIGNGSDKSGDFTLLILKKGKEIEVCYVWIETVKRYLCSDGPKNPRFNFCRDPKAIKEAEIFSKEYEKTLDL